MSDEPKLKASTQQFKAPEGTKPVPPAAPKRDSPAPHDTPWHPIEQAPKDGTALYFQNDPFADEWYWYVTREYRGMAWQKTGWWRRKLGPRAQPNFEPKGFRRVSEGLPHPPPKEAA